MSGLIPDTGGLVETISPLLEDIERRLINSTAGADDLVNEAAGHLTKAGGKRLRPVLTLLASQLGEGANEEVMRAAVAVELTHLATLYHDDVMDSAPLRRGVPSAHEVWGNSVAILTGDLLFARASSLVSSLGPEAVRIHAETFERLCLGQLHETFEPAPGTDRVAHYIQVLADKTGSLIATSALYGALYGGAGEATAKIMAAYGEKVGIAFQLADDVIDLGSDSETTGKTPGTDLREGVDTMPVLLLRKRAQAGTLDLEGREILAGLDRDLSSGSALAALVRKLREHEVLEQTRQMATQWAQDAVAQLDPLPEGEVKDALGSFANLLVDRMA